MEKLTEKFISARMDALEELLQADEEFQQQTKELHELSKAFRDGCEMSADGWKLYDAVEEAWIVNNVLYSQAAYKLGYADGFSLGRE